MTWKPHALTRGGRVLYGAARDVAQFSLRQRLPSAFSASEFVQARGLPSYGIPDSEAQSVTPLCIANVDRLLRGAKPADMPVIAPDRYELKINLRTAETLGVAIPPTVLVLADELVR